jgi:hypothetical protein
MVTEITEDAYILRSSVCIKGIEPGNKLLRYVSPFNHVKVIEPPQGSNRFMRFCLEMRV